MLKMARIFFVIAAVFLSACEQQAFLLAPASESHSSSITWNNKVDILWVIDNTPSMAQHQTVLAQKSGAFLNGLLSRNLDFRIAATTVDMRSGGTEGKFIGSPAVLTKSTPNIAAAFNQKITVAEAAYDLEQGLGGMKRALELRSSTNTGFFRSDALLVVIVVTNEDDGSPGNPSDYISFLDTIKPRTPIGERNWVFHMIGVTGAAGENCSTYGNYTEPGYRYMQLVDNSGGAKTTICTGDFSAALAGVEKRIYDTASRFYLDRVPDVSSIEVLINGNKIPNDPVNGWTYIAADNSIQLHGNAIARTDVKIDIFYQPIGTK
ncbi:MAG: hypothetical protein A4S09_04460 [Proteobacteria bacterium SG_bin7]|nr:MAG: hypothetical protein A4S09_04460 [Proteobacteria bacterium SG_bin7]